MTADPSRAILFHGLSDPARLKLLETLRSGPQRVNDLALATRLPQPNVSRHLTCLWDCGLVDRSRRGREVYYELGEGLEALLAAADPILRRAGSRIRSCPRYGRLTRARKAA